MKRLSCKSLSRKSVPLWTALVGGKTSSFTQLFQRPVNPRQIRNLTVAWARIKLLSPSETTPLYSALRAPRMLVGPTVRRKIERSSAGARAASCVYEWSVSISGLLCGRNNSLAQFRAVKFKLCWRSLSCFLAVIVTILSIFLSRRCMEIRQL